MGQVFRFLIIALAVWLAVLLLRRALRSDRSHRAEGSAPPKMLPCATCGVHVPETDALKRGGRSYCSEEHLPPEQR